jgi:hypothetical protein
MDLFRKMKKVSSGLDEGSLHVEDVVNEGQNEIQSHEEAMMQSIDDLVDSDPEEAEIFDDDEDELETPSRSVAGSTSSNRSAKSFKDVVQNLGGSPFLSIPTTVQPGTMIDFESSSKHSRRSLDGSQSSKASSHSGDEDLSSNDAGGATSDDKEDAEDEKGSDSAEDYTDDEDEGQDGYKAGGYHPVKVGEVYNQR